MSRIRIVKKNDEYTSEYQVGDLFEITGTWYGGVHIIGLDIIKRTRGED